MTGLRQLFNNLISAAKERMRHSEAECLEVDDQLEFCRLLDRQIGWPKLLYKCGQRKTTRFMSGLPLEADMARHDRVVQLRARSGKAPRDQEVRFRVALAGTLRLDVLNITIAERNRR